MPEEEWHNGNTYQDLKDLLKLVRVNDWHFESASPAYSPGGFTRAFGGHVYAQSAYAAGKTVKEGMVIHVSSLFFSLLYLWMFLEKKVTSRNKVIGLGFCFLNFWKSMNSHHFH
jgi:hypothetical protein